jgi:hypothetical protein
MKEEQRTHLHGVLRKTTETLRNKNYNDEAGEIDDLKTLFFNA